MILAIESVVLCLLFTVMVYAISREPIKSLYNYPPKIQERVKSCLPDIPLITSICYYLLDTVYGEKGSSCSRLCLDFVSEKSRVRTLQKNHQQ